MKEVLEIGAGIVLPLVIQGIKYLFTDNDNEGDNNTKDLEEKFSQKLEELQSEKEEMERRNKEYEKSIEHLKEVMKQNLEGQKKKELEREKELMEKEKKKREEEIEENKRAQEAILKCKEQLNDEFTKGIYQAMRNYQAEEKKWLNAINDENIQKKLSKYKKQLNLLFKVLYGHEKISEKMSEEFRKIIQKNANKKELNRMNFMVI